MSPAAEVQALFEHWHDFFVLAGTAAATLLGLLLMKVAHIKHLRRNP